ncbi:MAG: hydrogenase iron-sulfur subunit [Bacteroidota bacterium]
MQEEVKNNNDQTAKAWKPKILAIFCNWCTYTASDLAGVSRLKYPATTRVVRIMCSGRLDPQFILTAFNEGADAILIGGCHPGDCHYATGNYKCLRRFHLIQKYMKQMNIEPERLRLEWISASEGKRLSEVIGEMTETITKLGQSKIKNQMANIEK